MLLGSITAGGKLTGYQLTNHSANQLPQALASAVNRLFDGEGKLLGATYKPIWYIGSQQVNGKNHLLICEQSNSSKNASKRIVGVVINITADDIDGSKASIVEIIDDAELIEGTDLDINLREKFKNALNTLFGVQYTPILYVGSQIVKGTNYYVVAEAKIVRPDADPYAVMICFNVFNDSTIVTSIEHLA